MRCFLKGKGILDEVRRSGHIMLTPTQRSSALLMTLLITQVLAPIAMASGDDSPSLEVDTDADLAILSGVGIEVNADAQHGWLNLNDGTGVTNLLYRDAVMVNPSEWSTLTGESTVDGFHMLSHAYPVPSEWFHDLSDAGVECHSFLPPTTFHCDVNDLSPSELLDLDVQGLAVMDGVDKVRLDLARALQGLPTDSDNSFVNSAGGLVNVMLSGTELPDGLNQRNDVHLSSHSTRFATMAIEPSGLAWLVEQDAVEWVEPRPLFTLMNEEAVQIMEVDHMQDSSHMSGLDSSWNGLDGSGIIVTVADTGLDNGVNNSAMHPDFKDHITGILEFPPSAGACSYYSLGSWPCGDTAEDLHGHGTHVAGSVLGDGTHNTDNIVGAAPESHLLFHSIATTYNSEESLLGIPDDLDDLFSLAWANGSRVHTNSWGSDVAGAYTTSSAQADASARTYDELVILFAAANEGDDGDSDGEIDLDSMGSPATAKNVLTVGASENDRSTFGSYANNIEGMADFSSRGPTDDNRIKPDISAPGTWILSTKSRSTSSTGWGAYNASYTYMGGTSMATPLTAGATALLLEHLIENEGESNPTSALIKAMYVAGATDMAGQYGSSTNGAGETAPNNHEGWGRVNMTNTLDTTWLHGESVTTNAERGWSFNVPNSADDFTIALAWTDPASTPAASTNLVNDVDLAVKDPSGTWTNLSNNLDNLRGLKFSSPAQGTWEVRVVGTSIPTGPQFFALAMSGDYNLTNLTQDADLDGIIDSSDDCTNVAGTSSSDRNGCPDTDGDGYSNPDSTWTVNDGADAFSSDSTQWADTDYDGYGDNAVGNEPDACTSLAGNSTADRYGCTDGDGDGYSDPDGSWTTSNGADACDAIAGTSDQDRNGCTDTDGDGYSDPDMSWTSSNGADLFPNDATQWEDTDGDGYGNNPPPASNGDGCPSINGDSLHDRFGCTDSDGDGYSDPDGSWTVSQGADAFDADTTQWADADGDGYGDNATGNSPDACPSTAGTSTELGRLGCADTDSDGYADVDDAFPNEVTQWIDSDSDGFGDEPSGFEGDNCPSTAGSSTRDRFGCLDSDGDGSSDADSTWTTTNGADIAPNDASQWMDSDGDGYGDNPSGTNGDACPSTDGNSTTDRRGCQDTDGDGYSDPDGSWTIGNGADAYPNDPTRWGDADNDGYDDGLDDDCPAVFGTSVHDRKGCPDADGDGYSDPDVTWATGDGADAFIADATQWNDTDGDGFGDNASGSLPDSCPLTYGTSWQNNTLGCADGDLDGWADTQDSHPTDSTQWSDIDGDGYGDNAGGNLPDACPGVAGNSTNGNSFGCPDNDGDGWSNALDALPDLPTQWLDQDGDGYGDNATGIQPDACPGEAGNSTIDQFGCVDSDGDGVSNQTDDFPLDPTRTTDSDGDGYDDVEDLCPLVFGNSTVDRLGCLDLDGDGVSNPSAAAGNDSGWWPEDGADAFPLDPTQTSDADADGFGDNATGNEPDACPSEAGSSTIDRFGCIDTDSDGASDAGDAFVNESTQYLDTDGDGYGDNPQGVNPDLCPTTSGSSNVDRYGCVDSDGDGTSDDNDGWVNDSSQWTDSDGDGYGDEPLGTDGDACPTEAGTSTVNNEMGCPDGDGDGRADQSDAFPEERSQTTDADGDGWGDNDSLGAYKPDHWPNDPTRNSAESTMTCTPLIHRIDIAAGGYFTFACVVTTSMDASFAAHIEMQSTNALVGDSTSQFLTFTPTSGNTQTVTFSGEGKTVGEHQLQLMAREPGADNPMATVTVTIIVSDSNAPLVLVNDGTSSLMDYTENPLFQALLGGLVLFVLMGALVIRGQSKSKQHEQKRRARVEEIHRQYASDETSTPTMLQRKAETTIPSSVRKNRGPSMFDNYKSKK